MNMYRRQQLGVPPPYKQATYGDSWHSDPFGDDKEHKGKLQRWQNKRTIVAVLLLLAVLGLWCGYRFGGPATAGHNLKGDSVEQKNIPGEADLDLHEVDHIRVRNNSVNSGERGKSELQDKGKIEVLQGEVDRLRGLLVHAGLNPNGSFEGEPLLPMPRDVRPPECLALHYDIPKHLQSVSVIIPFVNESWANLERSVYSILQRTPPEFLKEIILVDDYNVGEEALWTPWEEMLAKFETFPAKVKLVHNRRREGLIRGKIIGANYASGNVLVFLESHIEANVGWLEPILGRLAECPKCVILPTVDIIDDITFEYVESAALRGGFDCSLTFRWIPLKYPDAPAAAPIETPAMSGGLLALTRDWWYESGEYDQGLEIWGGENMEMSFRVWMCGGRIEILPCSRVGHMFRTERTFKQFKENFPYSFGKNHMQDVVDRNVKRVAAVWLDDEFRQKCFYKRYPPHPREDFGDLTERFHLKERLECRPFHWYMNNIYPDFAMDKGEDEGQQLLEDSFDSFG